MPRTVLSRNGSLASSPSFCRSFEICTSIERSNARLGATAREIEQLLSRQDLPGALDQRAEDLEFVGGEYDVDPADRHAPRVDVELDDARAHPFLGPDCPTRATDIRANAREQFARRERFGYIVVSAGVEADDAIDLLATCRHHDDRHVVASAQLAADADPVPAGQHQVEQHRVERMLARRFQRERRSSDDRDDASAALEIASC